MVRYVFPLIFYRCGLSPFNMGSLGRLELTPTFWIFRVRSPGLRIFPEELPCLWGNVLFSFCNSLALGSHSLSDTSAAPVTILVLGPARGLRQGRCPPGVQETRAPCCWEEQGLRKRDDHLHVSPLQLPVPGTENLGADLVLRPFPRSQAPR